MLTVYESKYVTSPSAGLAPGPIKGLGPTGVNRRLDLTFGPLPLTAVIYMGVAVKPRIA